MRAGHTARYPQAKRPRGAADRGEGRGVDLRRGYAAFPGKIHQTIKLGRSAIPIHGVHPTDGYDLIDPVRQVGHLTVLLATRADLQSFENFGQMRLFPEKAVELPNPAGDLGFGAGDVGAAFVAAVKAHHDVVATHGQGKCGRAVDDAAVHRRPHRDVGAFMTAKFETCPGRLGPRYGEDRNVREQRRCNPD